MEKKVWYKEILNYKQSIFIIVVLIMTIIFVTIVYKRKIEDIIISELKQNIVDSSFGGVKALNNVFDGIVEVLNVVSQSLSAKQNIGGVSTVEAIRSITNVTGFINVGLVDIDGKIIHGFNLSPKEFKLLLPVFHGRPIMVSSKEDKYEGHDIIIAVPVVEGDFVKYALYLKVTNHELVNYLQVGRSKVTVGEDAISFMIYDIDSVIEINESTRNRAFPEYVLNYLKERFSHLNLADRSYIFEQQVNEIYHLELDNDSNYYLSIVPTAFPGWNYVFAIPSEAVDYKIKIIMNMLGVLVLSTVLVLTVLLMYYEYMMQKNKKSIHDLAYLDELTKCYNKSSLREFMNTVIRNSHIASKLYFVKISISNIAMVERLYGNNGVNTFILNCAHRLLEQKKDFVRFGRYNDDFVVILYDKSVDSVINRISTWCKNSDNLENYDYRAIYSCSIYESNRQELQEIDYDFDYCVNNCNIALSVNKIDKSKHSCVVYTSEMRDEVTRSDLLEKELEPALKTGEFLVYLQPKYDLKTNMLSGAEALIRWNYKHQGIMAPYKFIPIFERNGSIAKVDNFVLEEVLKLLKKWKSLDYRLIPISVNLSRVQFLNPKLLPELEEKIQDYKDVMSNIDIEITESATVDDQKSIIDIMNNLKKLGFRLSMDDFGTGYSSLSNISLLPFDTLKIDKSFVDKIDPEHVDSPSVYLIKDVISIAKHFNMHSLVEGVETKEQRNILRDLGCEYCQGYYYSKPLPVADFEKLLEEDKPFNG